MPNRNYKITKLKKKTVPSERNSFKQAFLKQKCILMPIIFDKFSGLINNCNLINCINEFY